MSKIGDVISGGTKIGEVWTDDSSDFLGCCLGIVVGPILVILAFYWMWNNEPEIPIGLLLFGASGLLINANTKGGLTTVVGIGLLFISLAMFAEGVYNVLHRYTDIELPFDWPTDFRGTLSRLQDDLNLPGA